MKQRRLSLYPHPVRPPVCASRPPLQWRILIMFPSLFRNLFSCSASRKTPYRNGKHKSACHLAVEQLEQRAVPAAIAPPTGILSWWTGDNSATDLLGVNHGSLLNGANYAAGKVAQGFNFDG